MSKLFKFMAKAGLITAVIAGLLVVVIGAALAATGPFFEPHIGGPSPTGTNHAGFWEAKFAAQGAVCTEVNYSSEDGGKVLTSDHDLLVIKAGSGDRANAYWFDVKAGEYYVHPDTNSISHIIVCEFEEEYEPCTETTDWVLVGQSEVTRPNGVVIKKFNYEKYDVYDSREVCDTMVAVERIPYETCSETTDWIAGPWSDWRTGFGGSEVRSRVHRKFDSFNRELVCARRAELQTRSVEWVVTVDCEKWSAFLFIGGEPFGGEKGTWKDLLTDESFTLTQHTEFGNYTIFVAEPQDCYSTCERMTDWVLVAEDVDTKYYVRYDAEDGETICDKTSECVSHKVFYWDDGFCSIRQRGGPIGGQQRPFVPMIYTYCGCGYEWGDWVGYFADSCVGNGEEYKFWNELPQFCGAQSCE